METKKYNTIVVADYAWRGHIPTYHKYICKALLELDYTVYSISPEPDEVKTWLSNRVSLNKAQFAVWDKNTSRQTTPHGAGPITSKIKPVISIRQRVMHAIVNFPPVKKLLAVHEYWKMLQKRLDEILPPGMQNFLVFIPYLDRKLMATNYGPLLFSRAFRMPWVGIFLHPTFFRLNTGNASAHLKMFANSTCKSIGLLDEGLIDKVEKIIGKPVIRFPDITNEDADRAKLTTLAQEVVKRANGRKIVSLLGVINNKKNIQALLRLVKLSGERKLPLFFLIAGENNKYYWDKPEDYDMVMKAITDFEENTFWHLQSVPDGIDYNALVIITDVLLAAYKDFYHSSNTLTKAALFRKPVIVSKGFLMHERVNKYGLGLAVDVNNSEEFLKAIQCLVQGVDLAGNKLKGQFENYYNQHNYESLKVALLEMTK